MVRTCCYCKRPLGESFEWLNNPSWDKYNFACPECRTKKIKEIKERKSKSNKLREGNKNE